MSSSRAHSTHHHVLAVAATTDGPALKGGGKARAAGMRINRRSGAVQSIRHPADPEARIGHHDAAKPPAKRPM
jgi:hypothetical protein